jgi:hypothetical protein
VVHLQYLNVDELLLYQTFMQVPSLQSESFVQVPSVKKFTLPALVDLKAFIPSNANPVEVIIARSETCLNKFKIFK